jgi:hypothetical protein
VPSLQMKIAAKFLEKLTQFEGFDQAKRAALEVQLTKDKKPKAEEFVAIWSMPPGEEIK